MIVRDIGLLMAIATLVCGRAGRAQDVGERQQTRRGGLRLYSVTAYTGYTSLGLPNANYNYMLGAVPMGADIQTGGSISVGALRLGPQSSVSLTYDASYSGLVRHSEWNSLNHALSFNADRRVGRKWDLRFSTNGSSSSMYQSLFTPSTLSNIAAVPASIDELAGAMLAGRFTNDQLASILTGAPNLQSPQQTVLYGERVLTASASTSVSYAPSARLAFHFGASASRSQYLGGGQGPEGTVAQAILPQTTAGNADAGFSYGLTPRTDFGLEANASRTVSFIQDVYMTRVLASIGRRVGQRWFVQAHAGPAWITPIRQMYGLPQGTQYAAGGSLGYRTFTQSILANADRAPTDTYGSGAGYTLSTGGTWRRHRPGSAWTLTASMQQQRMRGTVYQDLDGWIVSGGIARALSFQTAMQITYTYMNNSGTFLGAARDIQVHAIQLAFQWRGTREATQAAAGN